MPNDSPRPKLTGALAAFDPGKLVELASKLERERLTRDDNMVAEGRAVRVAVVHLDGETIEEARERALRHHGAVPEGVVPIFETTRICTGIEPSEKATASTHEPKPYDHDGERETVRHGIYVSPRNDLGPPPRQVAGDDGHVAHYHISADSLVQLCDAMGRPLAGELRARIPIGESPDRIARGLLRQRPNRDWDPFSDQELGGGGGFGRRRLDYEPVKF